MIHKPETIKYGVTQGSLFLFFINDLNLVTMLHFANDTYIYDEKSSIKEIDKFGNKNLIPLLCWLNPKWLFLNSTETEVAFFKRKSIALDTDFEFSNGK